MVNSTLFLMLLIAHLLGDYYFQNQKLAEKKENSYPALVIHSLIYAVAIALAFGFVNAPWWVFALAAGMHWVIDSVKWSLRKTFFPKIWLFLIDQLLHLLVLIALVLVSPEAALRPWLASFALPQAFWAWIALILLIVKPVNVSIDILFKRYKSAAEEETRMQEQQSVQNFLTGKTADTENPSKDMEKRPEEAEGAGAWVGALERLITVLFAAMGQYAAMGLLMAAKSMARYDKITKGPAFAEYYLIGTLFSLFFAIVSYLIIFKLVAPVPVVVNPTPILLITPTP